MLYHKTKGFQKLKAEWYKKLQDEGFEDIENGLESTPYLSGVRGTSTVIETAREGAAHSQVTFDRAVDALGELHGRQSAKEEIANRCLGRMSTERWLTTIYLAHNIPERTIASELGRSRVWVRQTAVAYRDACIKYAAGCLWSEVENMLQLTPLLPSDFRDL